MSGIVRSWQQCVEEIVIIPSDSSLNFEAHMSEKNINETNSILGIIRRTFENLDDMISGFLLFLSLLSDHISSMQTRYGVHI